MNTTEIRVEPLQKMLDYKGYYGEYGGAFVPPVLSDQLNKFLR